MYCCCLQHSSHAVDEDLCCQTSHVVFCWFFFVVRDINRTAVGFCCCCFVVFVLLLLFLISLTRVFFHLALTLWSGKFSCSDDVFNLSSWGGDFSSLSSHEKATLYTVGLVMALREVRKHKDLCTVIKQVKGKVNETVF